MLKRVWLVFLLLALTTACGPPAIATPVRPAGYGQNIAGQPTFPPLVEYWVVDNGCGFSQSAKENAYNVFEALNRDHIAQVAVVCQTGIKGGFSDASTWISEWLNHVGLGSMIDKRALAVLIRPDARPEDFRVILNPNDQLYWFTTIDELPIKQEAGDFANYNDFNGCLDSLVRNLNAFLRAKWKIYGSQTTQ